VSTFLTAEWRKLIMAQYAIDPTLLAPYLPAGLELDFHEGRCFVSSSASCSCASVLRVSLSPSTPISKR